MKTYQKIGIFFIAIFAIVIGCLLFIMSLAYISSPLTFIHDNTLYQLSKRDLYVSVIFGVICFIASFSDFLVGILLLSKKIRWSLYMAIVPVLILTVPTIIFVLLSIIPLSLENAFWIAGVHIIIPIFILTVISIIKMKKIIAG